MFKLNHLVQKINKKSIINTTVRHASGPKSPLFSIDEDKSLADKAKWEPNDFDQNDPFRRGVYINAFSMDGFRLNNHIKIIGPIVAFPRNVFAWNVGHVNDINEDSLCLFYLTKPKIDLVILGIGDTPMDAQLGRKLAHVMQKHKLNIEIFETYQACQQFNFLSAQGKSVAAAMIPPRIVKISDDDIIGTQARENVAGTWDTMHLPKT